MHVFGFGKWGEKIHKCVIWKEGRGVERYKCVTGRRGGGWRRTNV